MSTMLRMLVSVAAVAGAASMLWQAAAQADVEKEHVKVKGGYAHAATFVRIYDEDAGWCGSRHVFVFHVLDPEEQTIVQLYEMDYCSGFFSQCGDAFEGIFTPPTKKLQSAKIDEVELTLPCYGGVGERTVTLAVTWTGIGDISREQSRYHWTTGSDMSHLRSNGLYRDADVTIQLNGVVSAYTSGGIGYANTGELYIYRIVP